MTAWWRRDGRSAGPARLAYECGYDMAGTVVLVDAPGHVQDYLGRFFAPAATADDQVAAGLVVRVRPDSAGTVRIGYSSAGRWSGSLVVPAVEEGVTVRKLVRAWGLSGPDAAL
ncbi:MAG TPA: hypothetical protein VH352_22000, partial [Pseudonocardiaceae bacterium]|nr:hypothetical protein [Pseudonocardiaceae bacterium]